MPGHLASQRGLVGQPRQFGQPLGSPVRRFGGIAIVLLLHVVLIYALLNGLATRVVEVIQHPIEARIIVPVKPPPPPPPPLPVVKLTPPKVAPPPRPFVPPPEVPVQAAPQAGIAHQPVPVVSAPVVQAPPAPMAVKAPSHEVGVVCPNSDQVRASLRYPREAQENNITGNVLIEFVVDAQGHISDERVVQSADPILDRAALNTVRRFSCISQEQAVRVQVPFSFNLN